MTAKNVNYTENKPAYYPLDLLALGAAAGLDQNRIDGKAEVKMKRDGLINQILLNHYQEETRFDLRDFLDKLERAILVKALSIFNGNQKDAAAFLDMKYTTLHEKVKRHKIAFRKSPF